MHLARALADAGLTKESKAAMERFKQLGPAAKGGLPAGLVEYLAMTPEQQRADYRARVEKAYRETPDDPTAQVHYLKLLLEDVITAMLSGRPLPELLERPPREW